MSNTPRSIEDQIDAYLDGTLTSQQQTQFKNAMDDDEALRVVVTHGEAINSAVKRQFVVPDLPAWACADELAHRAEQNQSTPLTESASPDNRVNRIRKWLAMAAAIAMFVSGVVLFRMAILSGSTDGNGYIVGEQRTLAQAYDDIVEPQWACETDEEFAGTFKGRFGQAILFDTNAPNVTVAGLAYSHTLSPYTISLVGVANGNKTLVFVDRLERDIKPELPAGSGLNLYRRELGKLVLYEVSPNARAWVLDWIYEKGTDR